MKILTTLCLALVSLAAPADAPKPNIVIIVADDMGYNDAGFMGATQTRTPKLDKLAASGAVLRCHYVQPVCSPTRAALMTGRYATKTGVYTVVRPQAKWGLPLSERTLAQTLKEAGYETAAIGKWHLGEFQEAYRPTRRGFDHQYGPWFGAIDYFTHQRDGILDWHRNDEPSHDKGYSTHLLAEEAVRRIREKQPDKPLFLYLPFNAVHGPHQVPDSYPAAFPALDGVRKTYAGMLAAMDEAVGKVADALEAAKLIDNTLVMFTSDNGGASPGKVTDNTPLRAGKGTLHEGGVRACAFVTWPGRIKAGQIISEPLHAVDWHPTLAKIAGVRLPEKLELDGKDILPVLTEGAKSPHDSILLVGSSPNRAALRAGDWKLVLGGGRMDEEDAAVEKPVTKPKGKGRKGTGQASELFNLAADIGEARNLAAENPAKVAELEKMLAEHLKGAVPGGEPNSR
jgi:arylsulfatase A-like enzyme